MQPHHYIEHGPGFYCGWGLIFTAKSNELEQEIFNLGGTGVVVGVRFNRLLRIRLANPSHRTVDPLGQLEKDGRGQQLFFAQFSQRDFFGVWDK